MLCDDSSSRHSSSPTPWGYLFPPVQVADQAKLLTLLEDYLDEFNLSSTNALNLGEHNWGGPLP